MFGCLDDVVCMFNMLNLLMMYEPCVYLEVGLAKRVCGSTRGDP